VEAGERQEDDSPTKISAEAGEKEEEDSPFKLCVEAGMKDEDSPPELCVKAARGGGGG